MAKMLMGQIDHARGRIKSITAQKLGREPKAPLKVDTSEIMEKIKSKEIVLAPSQIKAALHNFINSVPVKAVVSDGGGYDYNLRRHTGQTYSISTTVRDNLPDCIADVIAGKTAEAEVDAWKVELDLYTHRKELLSAEATAVEDAIVLGDQAAALVALTAFAAFEV